MSSRQPRLPGPTRANQWWIGAASGTAVVLWTAVGVTTATTWQRPHAFLVVVAVAAGTATLSAMVLGNRTSIREMVEQQSATATSDARRLHDELVRYHEALDDRTLQIHKDVLHLIAHNAMSAARIQAQAEQISGKLDRYWAGYVDAWRDMGGEEPGRVLPFRSR